MSEKNPELKKLIGELASMKKKHALRNEWLAVRIGIGLGTVGRWLRGELHAPHIGTVRLLRNFIKDYEQARKQGQIEVFLDR